MAEQHLPTGETPKDMTPDSSTSQKQQDALRRIEDMAGGRDFDKLFPMPPPEECDEIDREHRELGPDFAKKVRENANK